MKTLLVLIVLFPIVLCFGLGYLYAGGERAFEENAERVVGTVQAVHHKTRFNGRDSEDITTVEVSYTTKDQKDLKAEAEIGYAVGLAAGKPVDVVYKKAEPQKIQIRAGFFNRPSAVVFLYLFGGFWLLLGLPLLVFIARIGAAAKDPAAKERIERMKEELRSKQAK